MSDLSITQKKEWARMLFLKDNLLQKEIAAKVGVTEKTIGKWINEESWDALRVASFITREEQISRTYKMIDALMTEIESLNKGVPNSKQSDVLSKLAATIKSLETEAGISQIVDVSKEFTNWLKAQDLKKAQDFIAYLDAFIKFKLKDL